MRRHALTTGSRPLPHLLGERTLRAIGVVLHTKVLVNLEQALLMRDRFCKRTPARTAAKQSRSGGFETPVRQLCGELGIFRPDIGIFREPEWKKHVGQSVRDAATNGPTISLHILLSLF